MLYDIIITVIFAYGLRMGIENEANHFVRLMLTNSHYYQFSAITLLTLIGALCSYYYLIYSYNKHMKKFYSLKNIELIGLSLLKGIIYTIPIRHILAGSTWALAYFGII